MILTSLQLIIGLFFSILFLQSGFDKVFNFSGNKGYISSVFEHTFLKAFSTLLFIVILVLEVAAGLCCIVGSVYYFFTHESAILLLGFQLSAISLLSLFLGQRIAKDYAGAAGLVPYFLAAIFGIYLFTV